MTAHRCLGLAAVLGFSAVLLGAFGAHGLKDSGYLRDKYAEAGDRNIAGHDVPASYKYYLDYQTAVEYHMWHALALMAVGCLMFRSRSGLLKAGAWLMTAGILLFSGALYILVIGGPRFAGIPWGMVAPVGGTLLLVAWILIAVWAFRLRSELQPGRSDSE